MSCKDLHSTENNASEKKDTLLKRDLSAEKNDFKPGSIKKIDVGYYERYQKLPKLTFEAVAEKEFLALVEKEYLQMVKPEQNDQFFFIQTALKKHRFKKYRDYGGEEGMSGYEFLGYYPDFKLFAITENSTAENLGFGQLILLDSANEYFYNIISFGDGSIALPIPSINNKYFVYFYNSVYEHKNCDIGVLKINDKSKPEAYLSEYTSYQSDDFAIEKIVWKSDRIFYVKGYQENYENKKWVKQFKYYKTEFK